MAGDDFRFILGVAVVENDCNIVSRKSVDGNKYSFIRVQPGKRPRRLIAPVHFKGFPILRSERLLELRRDGAIGYPFSEINWIRQQRNHAMEYIVSRMVPLTGLYQHAQQLGNAQIHEYL